MLPLSTSANVCGMAWALATAPWRADVAGPNTKPRLWPSTRAKWLLKKAAAERTAEAKARTRRHRPRPRRGPAYEEQQERLRIRRSQSMATDSQDAYSTDTGKHACWPATGSRKQEQSNWHSHQQGTETQQQSQRWGTMSAGSSATHQQWDGQHQHRPSWSGRPHHHHQQGEWQFVGPKWIWVSW